MPFRVQLSADFRPWRLVCLGCAVLLIALGLRFLAMAASIGGLVAVGPVLLAVGAFVSAAIFIAPSIVGTVARPLTSWFGDMFYPTETLRQPPESLLRALRMRIRDRYWESVDQQTRELIKAYGPSPELYHLRAHLHGGRDGSCSAATVEASSRLSGRDFERYTALLRSDPPPREIQTGIEA